MTCNRNFTTNIKPDVDEIRPDLGRIKLYVANITFDLANIARDVDDYKPDFGNIVLYVVNYERNVDDIRPYAGNI